MQPPVNNEVIAAYLTDLHQRRHLAPATVATYASILNQAHRDIADGLVSTTDFASEAELLAWLADDRWSISTRRLYTIAIRQFFRWLAERGYLDARHDPTASIPLPKKPRRIPQPATPEQVLRIITHAEQPIQLWSTIAAYAGARAIEISRLERSHIGEDAIKLWGKGDAERLVPTHPHLWTAVRHLPPGPITRLHPNQISIRAWREYRRIGVTTSIHKLRGYFATELRRRGVDPRVIQELLGHKSLATTEVYLGVDVAELAAAVSRLPTIAA